MDRHPFQNTMLMQHPHFELHYLKNDLYHSAIHVHPFYEVFSFSMDRLINM